MLTLELSPDLEARLAAEARARGLDLPAYAAKVLEQAAPAEFPVKGRTPEELESFLRAMAEGSETLPVIATEDFTRGSFYTDRG